MRKSLPLLTLLFFFCCSVQATVKTWIGNNTHWDDPNNWSPAGVPVKNDSVIINAGAAFYPVIDQNMEVFKHSAAGVPSVPYTCQYLYLAGGAQLNDDGQARGLAFQGDADIFGTINFSKSHIYCSPGEEVVGSFHANFTGATIYSTSLYTDNFPFPGIYYDSYINCYIEGAISLNNSYLLNTLMVGSLVLSGQVPSYFQGCTLRLKEKYGASLYAYNMLFNGGNTGTSFSVPLNITNDADTDDTLYVFTRPNGLNSPGLNQLDGNITLNTTNECARVYVGWGTHYRFGLNYTCPATLYSTDSVKINGNITINNKGIIDFQSPEAISGTINLNHGRIIRTYPCGVNIFPPGDTLNCPINFNQGRVDLSGGKLVINNDIITNDIVNADANHYLVTKSVNSSLTRSLRNSNGNVLFPVGVNDSYTPLYLAESGIAAINYSVRVSPGVYDHGTTGSQYSNKVVNRTWHISKPANANANATITLQWNLADELPGFFHDYCSISHYGNNAWHSGQGSMAAGSDPFQQVLANQNSFSPFAVGSGGVLPIGCISFTGVQKDNGIVLSWTTGAGPDHYHFLVQRSEDGISFTDIANMDAGTISSPRNFYYTDNRFRNGDNYYRIFEVDAGGHKVQLCNIIHVVGSVKQPFVLLLQNPVQQELPLQISVDADQPVVLSIYDIAGRQLMDKTVAVKKGSAKYTLNINHLSRGQYLLKASGTSDTQNLFFTR